MLNQNSGTSVPSGPVVKIVNGKGSYHGLCHLMFNCDNESGICSIAPSQQKSECCSYCYSAWQFKNNSYRTKVVKESEFKRIATKYPMYTLRIGKNMECGSKATREQLYQILENSIKYSTRPIITSKILEFDPKVSELIKKAKGMVHISLGTDSQELGAAAQGATNAWRLEQALTYKSDGCPVQVRIVADVTMPPTDFHTEVFQKIGGSRFVLLTPLHYPSKEVFAKTRQDITWDDAKSTGLFVYGQGDLRPAKFHAGWAPFKERCGTSYPKGKETEHCNNCGLGKFPVDKKVWKKKLSKLGWK